ncbi:MAG: DUF5666 domain-containing protein [Caldilineaceae bacterium]
MNSHTEIQSSSISARRATGSFWMLVLAFGLLALLSLVSLASPLQAAVLSATIPPQEKSELLGPIDQIVSGSEWIVAGISVHITTTTRVDERVAPAAPGEWAKIEGKGDGSGGLHAYRIKILPVHPHIKLEGPLTARASAAVQVDAISIPITGTTRIVGDPQPGVDRVGVFAERQPDGSLLATRVQKKGAPDAPPKDPDEDQPDAQDGVQLYGTIGSRPAGEDAGLWVISGVPVSVTAQTALVDRVGPLVDGAWVQVQGTVNESGQVVARRIRTISQRKNHRVKGVLQVLTETGLQVGGIALQRDANTKLEDNPTVGQPVEADAILLTNNALLAVKIESDDGEHENAEEHTVEFVGRVTSLPDGTLYGEWLVAGRRVLVTSGATQIDEHKGLITVNSLVKVEGTRNPDGSINALEIDVKRGEEDDNRPGDNHKFVRFVGTVEALPAAGLLGEWTVGGKKIVVNERTELDGSPTFAVSDTVKVKGYVQADGSVLAREIEKENEDANQGQKVKFTGEVQVLPAAGLLGVWTVDGKQVIVNTQTDLKDNAYAVSDRVKVEGRKLQNGAIIADKIKKDD